MPSNIAVKISADVSSLQSQLAIAKAESSQFTNELNKLARQALATGGATPQLNSQMQQVAAQMTAAKAKVTELKDAMGGSQTGFTRMTESLGLAREALGAFGVALSVERVVEFGKGVFEAAAQIYHQSEVLGLSTTAYQAFSRSAVLAGVATETVDGALKRFNSAQGAAQEGLKEQAAAFRDLGVSASLPAEEALPAIARSLLQMTDVARRARDETVLFGRSGQELNPVLEQWAEGADELTTKLDGMGLIMRDDVVKGAFEAEQAMNKAWLKAEVAWAGPIIAVTEAIAGLATAMSNVPDINDKLPKLPRPDEAASVGIIAGAKSSSDFGLGKSLSDAWQGMMDAGKLPAGPQIKTAPQLPGPVAVTGENPMFGDAMRKETEEWQKKQATDARRIADEVAKAYEQGNLRHIQSEEATNSHLLAMGQESLEQWHEQAIQLESDRYIAALDGVNKRIAADQQDKVKLAADLAEKAQMEQGYRDRLTAIDEEYQEKKRQTEQDALQAFIAVQQDRLATMTAELDREYQAGEISAKQRFGAEAVLTANIQSEILKRFDADNAGLIAGTAAYEKAMEERAKLEARFTGTSQKNADDLARAYAKAWQPVTSAFDQMVDGIISGNETLSQILIRAAETVAEDYIKQQLHQVEQSIFAEQAKTAAAEAGDAARMASHNAAAQAGSAADVAAGSASIMNDAMKAAAGAYSAVAGIPIIGPFLAPVAAGVAFTAVEAFDNLASFDVGTNVVPRDMIAQVHAGERIIPAADNSALMAAMAGGGSGQASHINITIQAVDAASVKRLMVANPEALRSGLTQMSHRLMRGKN